MYSNWLCIDTICTNVTRTLAAKFVDWRIMHHCALQPIVSTCWLMGYACMWLCLTHTCVSFTWDRYTNVITLLSIYIVLLTCGHVHIAFEWLWATASCAMLCVCMYGIWFSCYFSYWGAGGIQAHCWTQCYLMRMASAVLLTDLWETLALVNQNQSDMLATLYIYCMSNFIEAAVELVHFEAAVE